MLPVVFIYMLHGTKSSLYLTYFLYKASGKQHKYLKDDVWNVKQNSNSLCTLCASLQGNARLNTGVLATLQNYSFLKLQKL